MSRLSKNSYLTTVCAYWYQLLGLDYVWKPDLMLKKICSCPLNIHGDLQIFNKLHLQTPGANSINLSSFKKNSFLLYFSFLSLIFGIQSLVPNHLCVPVTCVQSFWIQSIVSTSSHFESSLLSSIVSSHFESSHFVSSHFESSHFVSSHSVSSLFCPVYTTDEFCLKKHYIT